MVDHTHHQPTPPGGAIGPIVQSELPPDAEAFAARAIQRLYLRRWLLVLCVCVTLIFVGVYKLPTVPALLGVLSIIAGGAFIPREGVTRPLALNLRTSSRQLASEAFTGILEGLPSPVILLDAQRRILHYNSLATDLWPALRPGDHISSHIRDPGVLGAVTNAHSGMRARQMVPYDQRVPIERHLEARISWIGRPANVQNVPAPAIMIHLRDLTERERIDRLRTDFVTNASHELRTPLSSLIGFIETLQGAARHDDAARDHFLDIMARQARRMARLIDNLLSLSRIEMRLHLRPDTPVNLVEIAEQVLTDLEPLAGQSGSNTDYVEGLLRALHELGVDDPHVAALATLLER
jgi:two-component system phosphate regulon sensor histidine kinase PhoR